jgi:hypothetical protein
VETYKSVISYSTELFLGRPSLFPINFHHFRAGVTLEMQELVAFLFSLLFLTGAFVNCMGYYSDNEGRFYFPEFRERARSAVDYQRPQVVSNVLTEAAGIYKDKSRGAERGLQKTVFITVVSYTDQAR